MISLQIDEEFKNILPPLTDEEYEQLEENILREGMLNPIVVWNGIIIDGHNRYSIVQKHPEISFTIKEMEFENRYAVIDWIITHQKGQRNLTEKQLMDLVGLLMEVRKLAEGNPNKERNPDGTFQLRKNCVVGDNKSDSHSGMTAREIGREFGISARTVDNAYAFHKGIEKIKNEAPDVANDILTGKLSVPKIVVQQVRNSDERELKETINAIKNGTIKNRKNNNSCKDNVDKETIDQETIEQEKQEIAAIKKVTSSLFDTTRTAEYDIDSLIRFIKINSEPYVQMIRQAINQHKDLCRDNKDMVISTIQENFIIKIEEIKEDIKKL